MEEEGSVTLVKGVVEMQTHGGNGEDIVKNKSLSKGHSLPNPLLNQLNSMPQQIMKSLSSSSYQIDSTWAYADDVEKGEIDHGLQS